MEVVVGVVILERDSVRDGGSGMMVVSDSRTIGSFYGRAHVCRERKGK